MPMALISVPIMPEGLGTKMAGLPNDAVCHCPATRCMVSNSPPGALPPAVGQEASDQNLRSASVRRSGGFPTMIAPFTAPMDEPTTQSGWKPPSCNAW